MTSSNSLINQKGGNMNNALLGKIIEITLVVIISVTLLIPIVNDQADAIEKMDDISYNNEPKASTYIGGVTKMAALEDTNVFAWDGTTLTFNDEAVDLTYSATAKPLIIAEKIYMTGQSGGWVITMCGTLNDATTESTRTIRNSTSDLTEMTLTITETNVVATYVVGDTTNTVTITESWGFAPSSTGKYIGMVNGMMSDFYYSDELWAASNTAGRMVSYSLTTGGMVDGESTTSVNTSELLSPTNIYKATIGADVSGDSIQVNSSLGNPQRLFGYVVPATVSYSPGDNDYLGTLLLTIPVVVIISIILFAVGLITRRND